ncbi:MAG: Terminase-like family protein, partial [Eisenbergiella sp.]
GHGWVKSHFVKAAKPYHTAFTDLEVKRPDGTIQRMLKSKIFIPSSVFDNQKLLENNPNYLASLAMLPAAERDALLYGSWDSFDGQVFTEFTDDPKGYDTQCYTHVINPFRIPDDWLIYRGFDFGYANRS